MLKATRLDHPSIRGITFFLDRVDARPLGMHVHWKNHCEQCIYLYDQSNDNGPGDAEMAIFPGKTSVEWYPLYFYVPIGKDDKIVGFGILRTKEPILHGTELATKMVPHALMVRLEHAGDIIASQNHLVNKPMETFDWCLAQSRGSGPVALVYGVPHYGCLIWEWFGGYDGTNPEKHCRFEPKFELPPSLKHRGLNFSDCDDAIYTWAPLDGLESATEYHDGLPKYGYGSSGILLRYNDGSQRTVGECSITLSEHNDYHEPKTVHWTTTSTGRYLVGFSQDDSERSTRRFQGWESAPAKGRIEFWNHYCDGLSRILISS